MSHVFELKRPTSGLKRAHLERNTSGEASASRKIIVNNGDAHCPVQQSIPVDTTHVGLLLENSGGCVVRISKNATDAKIVA